MATSKQPPSQPVRLERLETWIVTISHWGVLPPDTEPKLVQGWDSSINDDGAYHAHRLRFRHRPTRRDFMFAIPAYLRRDELIATLEQNPFPLCYYGLKAISQNLYDDQGNHVGKLEVRRDEMYANSNRSIPSLDRDIRVSVISRLPLDKRGQAEDVLNLNENRVRERLMELPDGYTKQQERKEYRRVLVQAGIIKRI